MIKKIFRGLGIFLSVLVLLILAASIALYLRGQSKMSQTYTVQLESVAIPTDTAAIARGKKLIAVLCVDCHGENLAGTAFFDDPGLGKIPAKNLTRGKGGVGAIYTEIDFVRVLRHGIRPDGTSVFVMPSKDFYYLSDADLGSIIAYLKTAPPVDQDMGVKQLSPLGIILTGAGVFDSSNMAEQINHSAPRPSAPAIGVTKEYGEYLARLGGCRNCHGAQLAGGPVADPTSTLRGPNLTPGGELVAWSQTDFIKAIRTGVTPSGHTIDKVMPWKTYAKQTDDELIAIFLYLQSLPKLATATQ